MNRYRVWLATLPLLAGLAHAEEQAERTDWRKANRQVAEFPRGHADVLKWEQARSKTAQDASSPKATLVLADIGQAVRLAWGAHPELATPLRRLGAQDVAAISDGHWSTLPASRVLAIAGTDEVLEVAYDTRKALLNAIAQVQSQPYRQQALQAAEVGTELGNRMAAVGNWSALQATRQQLASAETDRQWQRSQYAFRLGEVQVLKALGQWTRSPLHTLRLPASLPSLPEKPMAEALLQQRVEALAGRLADAERIALLAEVTVAWQAYQSAYTLARSQLEQGLKLQQLIYDETALRYNGMLSSTWALLAETQALAASRVAAVDATRDFWLADANLQWLLLGGKPAPLVLAGAEGSAGGAPGGH